MEEGDPRAKSAQSRCCDALAERHLKQRHWKFALKYALLNIKLLPSSTARAASKKCLEVKLLNIKI